MYRGLKMPEWGAIVSALGGAGAGAAGAGAGAAGAAGAGAAGAGAAGAGLTAAGVASGGAGALGASAAGAGAAGATGAAGGGLLGGIAAGAQKLYQMGETTKLDSFTDPATGQLDPGAIFSASRRQDYSRMRKAISDIGENPQHANVIGEIAKRRDDTYYGDLNHPEGTQQQGDPLRDEILRRLGLA